MNFQLMAFDPSIDTCEKTTAAQQPAGHGQDAHEAFEVMVWHQEGHQEVLLPLCFASSGPTELLAGPLSAKD